MSSEQELTCWSNIIKPLQFGNQKALISFHEKRDSINKCFLMTQNTVVKSNVSVSGVMVIILECWGTLVKMQS